MPAVTSESHHETTNGVHSSPKTILKNEINGHTNGHVELARNGQTNGHPKSRAPSYEDPSTSLFTPICHPLVSEVTRDVDGYYLENWGFPSEASKKKFVAAGYSRVTCLYFPKAQDDRIRFACSLLTILFLVDGMFYRPCSSHTTIQKHIPRFIDRQLIIRTHANKKQWNRSTGIHVLSRRRGLQC